MPHHAGFACGAFDFAFFPLVSLSSLTNGASIISTLYYNDRLQPCRISVKSSGTAPATCTDSATGNVVDFSYNFSLGTSDNGNVTAITNNRDTTRSQSFSYDSLNRISLGETTSTYAISPSHCWGEQLAYDPWGNLQSISGASSAYTGCTQESLSVTPATNNQISGFCYDAAGNLLAQSAPPCPSPTYTYNAENQMTLTAGVTYTYDGDGKRVQKSSGKLYWYGTGSDPLDETDLTGSITNSTFKEYILFNSQRIARRDSTNAVNYYFSDHLGTARIVANSSGTVLDDSDFYPFGGERAITSSSGNTYKFTGKERDSESGLDNFGARYYSNRFGRWLSADWSAVPVPVPYANLTNPQTLNLYSMVADDPESFADLDGHCCWQEIKDFGIGVLKGAVLSTVPGGRVFYDTYGSFVSGNMANKAPQFVDPPSNGMQAAGSVVGVVATYTAISVVAGGPEPIETESAGITSVLSDPAALGPEIGETVYRVWGGKSGPYGQSWTPVNPDTVPNYRDAAGLPDTNTGIQTTTGTLTNTAGVTAKPATALDGNKGGLPEYVIPDPKTQVQIKSIKENPPPPNP